MRGARLCRNTGSDLQEAIVKASNSYLLGAPITRDTIYGLLRLCSHKKDLVATRQIQSLMFLLGLESVSSLSDHLIRIFSACGSFLEASRSFSMISKPSVYSWSAIISCHADFGIGNDAFQLFIAMQNSGISPDKVAFLCILRVCGHVRALECGKIIHHQVVESGLESDVAISSALIVVYTNCDHIEDAGIVFDNVRIADEVIYGAMITGYTKNDQGFAALGLFERMLRKGIVLNEVICSCILKACICTGEIEWGMIIHHQVLENAVDTDVFVGSSLIDMYSKGGHLMEARKVFDLLPTRNIVSWGAMIGGYAQCGDGFSALLLYEKMQHAGLKPDKCLLSHALKACESIGLLKYCRFLHDIIIKTSVDSDILLGNALVEVYGIQGSLMEGYNSFEKIMRKNTDSWNALIGGYAVNGHSLRVIELFEEMQRQEFVANHITYSHLLKACSFTSEKDKVRELHSQIMRIGLESDGSIGSSLIDVYAKRHFLEEAQKVFDGIRDKDVVSWGALLSAYSEHGHCSYVCELYDEMKLKGIKPDKAIFLCILKACGITGSLKQGHQVHYEVIRCNLELGLTVGNTIIDMYAKCGSLDEARKIFYSLPHQDEVSWAALIGGYGRHGYCGEVGRFIGAMKEHGLMPKISIFTSLLAACSHTGELEDGLVYFNTMVEVGIEPAMEHYSCMADLLGRKGCLNEAKDVLQSMPVPPDIVVWMSMLTGCRTYGEVDSGGECFDYISQMDVNDSLEHVLMWNIHGNDWMWGGCREIAPSSFKHPGLLSISNKAHDFLAGCHTSSIT